MKALLFRDLKLGLRAGAGFYIGPVFYLCVIIMTPFAVGPDLPLLGQIGPAILWIGALLAGLLGLDRLFRDDFEDGSLEVLIVAHDIFGLIAVVFVKAAALWILSILPLVVITPVLGLMLNMDGGAIAVVTLSLLVGSPAIIFIGALGAGVALGLPRGGLLIPVIILPLVVPVLIFGVSVGYGEEALFSFPLMMLMALNLMFAVVGPVATAFVLVQTET